MTALLVIIYLSFVGLGLPNSVLGSIWPQMQMELGADVSLVGYLSMNVTAGTVASSVLADRIVRRLGVARVTVISVLMTAGALLGFALSPGVEGLFLCALPMGLAAGAADVALNNFVALHYEAKHMSWLHCFWGIGASVGPMLVAASLRTGASWRTGYGLISAVVCALCVILICTLPLWGRASGGAGGHQRAAPICVGHIFRRRDVLPLLCGCVALLEYLLLPNNSRNARPWSYVWVLGAAMCAYLLCLCVSLLRKRRGEKRMYEKLYYKAPHFSALFLFLALYDYLTLKTGILTQPFVPCMNYIINAFLVDYKLLADCTLNTLKLLFLGYSIGVSLGLITGIACGYSERARYWLDPIIKFLGPIPTSTWIPIIMVVASSLFGGAVFIIALGSWFAVTVASLTGISNVSKEYFDAAMTLGANSRQLVFRVAIPHAMPSILQGCTQAMSSSCVAIMIAEMLGVKSGLGWYMTWQTGWASYDKSFAALFVICLIFTLVTKGLERIKRYLLRWQNGAVK